MEKGQEETTYATFKGLGYNSMWWGVPLGPLLFLFGTGALLGLILVMMFGAWGLIAPMVSMVIILALKVICETDNKAMERTALSLKAWRLRARYGSTVLTVSPNQTSSKHENFLARFKEIYFTR